MSQTPSSPTPKTSPLPLAPQTIEPYLHQALHHPNLEGTVSIYKPLPPPPKYPPLSPTTPHTLLLYPGSFNPPHIGHLATIHYLFAHRQALSLTTLFLYSDPHTTIHSKHKAHNITILPLSLRNEIFASTPSLQPLLASGWLHILTGSMSSHIAFLRLVTDLLLADSYRVKLVGFLGGDKLSVDCAPRELGIWGPVDEFLIVNARRPVDFYTPGEDAFPRVLPGCTEWERGAGGEEEEEVGDEWVCRASTVPGEPVIRFRRSESSASNGVSSTGIRKIMCEASEEALYGELAPHVLGVEMLIEWLKKRRREEGEESEIRGESVVEG